MAEPERDPDLENLLEYVREHRGFDFTGYKRASLERRIRRRMQDVEIDDLKTYQDYLEVHPDEFTQLFNTILINVTSFYLIKATPKGGLHNPYNDNLPAMVEVGHKKYLSFSCNGCHGGGGGGGMCVPLTNDTWVYGPDDDTLFRLIALGSDELKKQGYKRVKNEVVVGPMPPFGTIIKTSDDMWKVIAWMRSVNPGSEKKPPLQ